MPDQDDFHEPYRDYANTLRAWLVGYGVGAPVLFLTQSPIADAIAESGSARLLVGMYVTGVALQVLIALVNKWNNWYLYAKSPSDGIVSAAYEFAERLSMCWLLDFICDLGSILLFGWATALGMLAVLSPAA